MHYFIKHIRAQALIFQIISHLAFILILVINANHYRPHPGSYHPFNIGPQSCIGKVFAMVSHACHVIIM